MNQQKTIQDSKRLFLVISRFCTMYNDDRLKLLDVRVCKEAGIALEALEPAQQLLVSAGLMQVHKGNAKATYTRNAQMIATGRP